MRQAGQMITVNLFVVVPGAGYTAAESGRCRAQQSGGISGREKAIALAGMCSWLQSLNSKLHNEANDFQKRSVNSDSSVNEEHLTL